MKTDLLDQILAWPQPDPGARLRVAEAIASPRRLWEALKARFGDVALRGRWREVGDKAAEVFGECAARPVSAAHCHVQRLLWCAEQAADPDQAVELSAG